MVAAVALALGILAGRFAAEASTGFAGNLRDAMYENIQRFSFSNIDKFSTAGLVTRMTTDVTNLQNAFQMIMRMCVRAPVHLIFALIMACMINVHLTGIFIVAIIFLVVVLVGIMVPTFKLFDKVFKSYDNLNASVQENVAAIRVVKSFVREGYENEKYSKACDYLYKQFVKAESRLSFNNPAMLTAVYGCNLALSWFGANFVLKGTITTGQLNALFGYVMNILMSLMMLSMAFVMLSMSAASAKRIVEVLDEKTDLGEPEKPVFEMKDGGIEFDHVTFKYKHGTGNAGLTEINFTIKPGETIGIIGGTGSGKSSLVNEILYKTLAGELNGARSRPGKSDGVDGLEYVDKVIGIDQQPIGRTPRSNPATYTGVFNDIRAVFAQTQDAKMRGYGPGRFSFNVKGGRCEACEGNGILQIEMHFLPDVYVPCEVCKGARYNRETLEVKYKEKTIADVLNMTVEEAVVFFANQPKIARKLQTLVDVGLGYVTLGQSATTLSGGEAQRVKLANELARRSTGKTVYILDEPTTGLHIADVHRLIEVLQKLVDAGNTVIVIEHNLDLIKCADHIIDLRPEGGSAGGLIVATGTPEQVAAVPESFTGQYLKPLLERDKQRAEPAPEEE